jgi:hypothetical protein
MIYLGRCIRRSCLPPPFGTRVCQLMSAGVLLQHSRQALNRTLDRTTMTSDSVPSLRIPLPLIALHALIQCIQSLHILLI